MQQKKEVEQLQEVMTGSRKGVGLGWGQRVGYLKEQTWVGCEVEK